MLPEQQYTRCGNIAFANFVAAIARIQTSLNSCHWSQRQNSAAATMIFTKLSMSHDANCCGDLSPRRVAATYRIVCPGLKATFPDSRLLKSPNTVSRS